MYGEGKILTISYQEMMDCHIPPPTTGDCSDEDLVSDCLRAHLKLMDPKPKSVMYEADVSWFKRLMDFVQKLTEDEEHSFYITIRSNRSTEVYKTIRHVDAAMYHGIRDVSRWTDADDFDWGSVELSIVFRSDADLDPFDEPADEAMFYADKRQAILEQLTNSASLVFERQHRTHHFTLLLMGRHARVIRWDRSGVMTTGKFDYVDKPELLTSLLWRYTRLSDEQRGHDATAKRLLSDHPLYKLMDEPVKNGNNILEQHAYDMFKDSLSGNRYLTEVYNDALKKTRLFVIGEPTVTPEGLIGCGTRGYVALEVEKQSEEWSAKQGYVWFKDCWRVEVEGTEREGDILGKLNEADVERVPTLVCHGDVPGQTTRLREAWYQHYPNEEAKYCPFRTLVHYRMIVAEVCLPLDRFLYGKQLLRLILQCMEAHWNAWLAGFKHRDISAGNLLIKITYVMKDGVLKAQWEGILGDWELSTAVSDTGETGNPRAMGRVGTWAFLSVAVLSNPAKIVTAADELESFFHVLLWFAIRYLPNNCLNVGDFIHRYFDDYHQGASDLQRCGMKKLDVAHSGKIMVPGSAESLGFFRRKLVPSQSAPVMVPHPITLVIERFLEIIHCHYTVASSKKIPTENVIKEDKHAAYCARLKQRVTAKLNKESSVQHVERGENCMSRVGHLDNREDRVEREVEIDPRLELKEKRRKKIKENARKLQRHEDILRVLLDVLRDKTLEWPTDDKTLDQLAPKCKSQAKKEAPVDRGLKRTCEVHEAQSEEQPPAKRFKLDD